MRKLREAAVVAAMIGSVGMLGAGVASAGEGQEPPLVQCTQDNGDNTVENVENGLLGVESLTLGGSGDAEINQNQQICGIGNTNNTQESGDATSGEGGDGTIGVGVTL